MSIAIARRQALAPLIDQPQLGTLTRMSDVVHRKGPRDKKARPGVLAICVCGTLMFVVLSQWLDGSVRPRSCAGCRRYSQRFATMPRRVVMPFHEGRGR